ncbi:Zn ribbon-like protein [Nostoc cycadae WK-1]|nr:Zn ribbon-like protein [Nostoc cycadae WK-1]
MTVTPQTEKDKLQASTSIEINQEIAAEKILCPHCLRTATNGIKCKGICVADSDY